MCKIEKNIPPKGDPFTYPFAKMKDGDSFIGDKKAVNEAIRFGKNTGTWFANKKIKRGVYKIWRKDSMLDFNELEYDLPEMTSEEFKKLYSGEYQPDAWESFTDDQLKEIKSTWLYPEDRKRAKKILLERERGK